MSDVQTIANGLSEAQRAYLALTAETPIIDIILFAPNAAPLTGQLRDLGLIDGLGDATGLTCRGLAVREHLLNASASSARNTEGEA